MNSRRDTFAC